MRTPGSARTQATAKITPAAGNRSQGKTVASCSKSSLAKYVKQAIAETATKSIQPVPIQTGEIFMGPNA
jgi:hypothetical protein